VARVSGRWCWSYEVISCPALQGQPAKQERSHNRMKEGTDVEWRSANRALARAWPVDYRYYRMPKRSGRGSVVRAQLHQTRSSAGSCVVLPDLAADWASTCALSRAPVNMALRRQSTTMPTSMAPAFLVNDHQPRLLPGAGRRHPRTSAQGRIVEYRPLGAAGSRFQSVCSEPEPEKEARGRCPAVMVRPRRRSDPDPGAGCRVTPGCQPEHPTY